MHSDLAIHLADARTADIRRRAPPRPPSSSLALRVARYWGHGDARDEHPDRRADGGARGARGRAGGRGRRAPVARVHRG